MLNGFFFRLLIVFVLFTKTLFLPLGLQQAGSNVTNRQSDYNFLLILKLSTAVELLALLFPPETSVGRLGCQMAP
jgi:hypothetical protein